MHRIDAAHGICLCIGQLIKILSHGQTRVSLQSHVLDGAHIGTTQPIWLNDLCASVMWSCVVLLWPLILLLLLLDTCKNVIVWGS